MIERASRRRNIDLLVVLSLTALLLIIVLAVHVTLVRVLCAVPLCLAAPGYAVSAAIFGTIQRERAAALMLTTGLSLVVLVLGGIVLDQVPGGIRASSWAVLIMLVVLVSTLVAWRRREAELATGAPRVHVGSWTPPRPRLINVLVLLVALVVAVGAVVASRMPLGARNITGYETLGLTPSAGDRAVEVSLTSGREHTAAYTLTVSAGAQQVQRTVILAPGASDRFRILLGAAAGARKVTATAGVIGSGNPVQQANITLPAP